MSAINIARASDLTWRGELSAFPANPKAGDQFYHTLYKCVIVRAGNAWRQTEHASVDTKAVLDTLSTAGLPVGFKAMTNNREEYEWTGARWQRIGTGRAWNKLLPVSSTQLTLVGGAAYLQIMTQTMPARSGEWVRTGVSYVADNQTGDIRGEVVTIVNNTRINYFSGGNANWSGIMAFGCIGGRYDKVGGSFMYQLKDNDIAADGTVTLDLIMKAVATRAIFRSDSDRFHWWGEIIG